MKGSNHYFIPRNYGEAGRLFGMFQTRNVLQSLIWAIPWSLIIIYMPMLGMNIKLYLWAFVVGIPVVICLLGVFDLVLMILKWRKNRRRHVLYD